MHTLRTAMITAMVLLGSSALQAQTDSSVEELIALAEDEIGMATEVIPVGKAFDSGYGLTKGLQRVTGVEFGYLVEQIRITSDKGTREHSGPFHLTYFTARILRDAPYPVVVGIQSIPRVHSVEEERTNMIVDSTTIQHVLKLRMQAGSLVVDYEEYPPDYWANNLPPSVVRKNVGISAVQRMRLSEVYRTLLERSESVFEKKPYKVTYE